jgi:hypothetical protein
MQRYILAPVALLTLAACTKSPDELCDRRTSFDTKNTQSKEDCVWGLEMMQNLDKKKYESFAACAGAASDLNGWNDCVAKHPGKLSDAR